MPTDTYQRHRHDETWTWSEDGPVVAFATHLDLDLPHADEAVLALNISGAIQPRELPPN